MKLCEFNPYVRYVDMRNSIAKYKHFVMAYDYRLLYANNGALKVIFEDTFKVLEPGHIIIIPPATKYMITPVQDCTFTVLNFDMDYRNSNVMEPVSSQAEDKFQGKNILSNSICEDIPLFMSCDENVEKMLTEIYKIYNEKSFCYNEKMTALLKMVVVNSVIYTREYKTPNIVNEVKKYIEGNYNQNITNDELGNRFLYHPNYLNRLFKKHIQMSLHEFIIDLRLIKSVELIKKTDISISQVGELCGFSSSTYFIKKFREKYGLSPLKLRNLKYKKI